MWNQQKNTEKKFQFGDYVLWFPKGKKTHMGKFKKIWFSPFRVQYCLPNNIVLIIFVSNFEPNLVLVNINKLKPCGLDIEKDSKFRGLNFFFKSIKEDHMEETSNENSEDQRETKTIRTD
jgi:hypothetical protein